MSVCRACGAAIVWADRDDGAGRIALDTHEQFVDDGGYRIEDGLAVPVAPSPNALVFRPHAETCSQAIRRGVPG